MAMHRYGLQLVITVGLATGLFSLPGQAADGKMSYEQAVAQVDALDKGGRWLSLGIGEVNELTALPEELAISITQHLYELIRRPELRQDGLVHDRFIEEIAAAGAPTEALEITKRAHSRVSLPLALHEGYWVARIDAPGMPFKITVINDIHVDAATGRVTVYAQNRLRRRVLAPAQVSPGEYARLPNGDRVAFHPNAVYLNGSGKELAESDGTGAWWVKQSWVIGGEGFSNWELRPEEEYGEGVWVEGKLLDDGITIQIGPADESLGYNTRRPVFSADDVAYEVVRWGPKNLDPKNGPIDKTLEAKMVIEWTHQTEQSPLDGLARKAPVPR